MASSVGASAAMRSICNVHPDERDKCKGGLGTCAHCAECYCENHRQRRLAAIGVWKGHVCTAHQKREEHHEAPVAEALDELKILKLRTECRAFAVPAPEGDELATMLTWREEEVRTFFRSGGKERPPCSG